MTLSAYMRLKPGAGADNEEFQDACEMEEVIFEAISTFEVRKGRKGGSKVAKENRALTKSFRGLKMHEGQQ